MLLSRLIQIAMEQKLARIYLEEVKKEIKYKDLRSIKKWCSLNGVKVFKDSGSNKPFVLELEFIRAYNLPIMQSVDRLKSAMNFSSHYFSALANRSQNSKSTEKIDSDFLRMLRNIKPDI